MVDNQSLKFLELLSNPAYGLLFAVLALWSLAWKGVALWNAAKLGQKNWFIAMLLLNTLGILEIIYLFYFKKKPAVPPPPNL